MPVFQLLHTTHFWSRPCLIQQIQHTNNNYIIVFSFIPSTRILQPLALPSLDVCRFFFWFGLVDAFFYFGYSFGRVLSFIFYIFLFSFSFCFSTSRFRSHDHVSILLFFSFLCFAKFLIVHDMIHRYSVLSNMHVSFCLNSEHWTWSNQPFCCSIIGFSTHTQFQFCVR